MTLRKLTHVPARPDSLCIRLPNIMVSETETFKPNDSPYTSREMGPRTHQMLTLAWNAVPSSRTERFPAKKRASCHGRYLRAFPANSARGSGRADPEKTPASSMPSRVTTGGRSTGCRNCKGTQDGVEAKWQYGGGTQGTPSRPAAEM